MRKSVLRQHAERYLMEDNRGSYREKSYRRFVLYNMINALFAIGDVPPKWHALQQTHVQKLLTYWQEKKISSATIMKYMTVVRKFLEAIGHYPIGIDNKTLGLSRPSALSKRTVISFQTIEAIQHPITKIILQLQIHFGLTFSETIHLLKDIHIQEKHLWITREISSNSLDRVIPIRTHHQVLILQDLSTIIGTHDCLLTAYGYDAIRHAYRNNLTSVNLPHKKSYRYLYAQTRHNELSATLRNYELTLLLMREMGLQSRVTLWGYLRNE